MSAAGNIAHCLSPGAYWFAGPVAVNGALGGSQNYYLRTDDYTNWAVTPTALPLSKITMTRMSVARRALFMTFHQDNAAVSFDNGDTFVECDSELDETQDVYWNGRYFVCGSEWSEDGISWTTIDNLPGTPVLTIARLSDGAIIIVYEDTGDYIFGYTLDQGATWTTEPAMYAGAVVSALMTNGSRINFTIANILGVGLSSVYTDDFFVTQELGPDLWSGTYYGQYGCGTLLQNEFSNRIISSWDGGFSWLTVIEPAVTQVNNHHMQFGDNVWGTLLIDTPGGPTLNKLAISTDGGRTWDADVADIYGTTTDLAYVGPRGSCNFYTPPEYVLFTDSSALSGTPDTAECVGHRSWGTRVPVASPDGEFIYNSRNSTDPELQVYQLASNGFGYNLLSSAVFRDTTGNIAVSYTGEYVCTDLTAGEGEGIAVYRKNGLTWNELVVPGSNNTSRQFVAFSPRSNVLVVGNAIAGTMMFYTISGDTISGPYSYSPGNTILQVSFAHDHDWLIAQANVASYRIVDFTDPTTPVQMATNAVFANNQKRRFFSEDDSHVLVVSGTVDPGFIGSQSWDGVSTLGGGVSLGNIGYRVLAAQETRDGLFVAVGRDVSVPYASIYGISPDGTSITYSRDYTIGEVPDTNTGGFTWVGV